MISQCVAISSNLGFQFCQLGVIEWPGNLVVELGREHFLMSQKHSTCSRKLKFENRFCRVGN